MSRVVIVGGGISGLAAAYDLNRAGVDSVVFEKQPRVGGVIQTQTQDGCVLERGPDSFLSAKPEALALIKELGFQNEVIGSNDHQRTTYILRHGRLVKLPEGVMMIVPSKAMPIVTSRLLGWGTKIKMALELLRRPPVQGRNAPDRSIADFVIDHFGEETLDYLAEPLLSGVYGGDPRHLSMASVMPRFLQMEAQYGSLGRAVMTSASQPRASGGPLFQTLKSGLQSLIDALSPRLNVQHAEVDTVERTAGGFGIRAGGSWTYANQVILACPAWSASGLVETLDAQLAGLLSGIAYSSSVILSMIFNASSFDGMQAGFGFLIPKVERRRLAAATFVATKFPNRAPQDRIVLRCFFGGIGDEGVLNESDESLLALARDELQGILGLTAAPVFHSVSRWPRAMAQYNVGHAARLREIHERAAGIPGLHLAGNAYEGIGISDCIRTGRAAARQVLAGAAVTSSSPR
jgi:oxygen-dependent protoporphyrinogen oxidase